MKILPSNRESERIILGYLLLDSQKIAAIGTQIGSSDFYDGNHARLFDIMVERFREDGAFDVVSIFSRTPERIIDAIGGSAFLATISTEAVGITSIDHHIRTVRELSMRRRIIIAGQRISEIGESFDGDSSESISKAQAEIVSVLQSDRSSEKSSSRDISEEYSRLQDEYEEKKRNGLSLLGMSSGVAMLDGMTEGIRRGSIFVIGGYTSTGKTAFALNIMNALLNQGKRVVFYSLEMTRVDLFSRLIGIMTDRPSIRLLKAGPDSRDDFEILEGAKQQLASSDFSIRTKERDIDALTLSMKSEIFIRPVDCFFVDFIQLVTMKGAKSEYEGMTNSIIRLQQIAGETGVPIIVLSQVNNEHVKTGRKGGVMGFKGSGGIAAAADVAIELARADKPEDVAMKQSGGLCLNIDVHVQKVRNGPTGKIEMSFNSETGRFYPGREVSIHHHK